MPNRCWVLLVVALLSSALACSKGSRVTSEANEAEVAAKPADRLDSALTVGRLRWDASEHPIGMLRLEPRLDWRLSSTERGQQQTAYQVLVASDAALLAAGKPDVWDSGKVPGADSLDVVYRGPGLSARQRGFWTVRAWDEQDRPSAYAEPASWEVGPWDEEVEGDWIGRASDPNDSASERERSVSYFRRAFTIPAGFKGARLYATAFGLYEMQINGRPVTEDVLTPGFSDYEKRVLVQTRDVTALLRAGDNVLAATLAGGWCTARLNGAEGRCGSEPPRLRFRRSKATMIGSTRRDRSSRRTYSKARATTLAAKCPAGTRPASTIAVGGRRWSTTETPSAMFTRTRAHPFASTASSRRSRSASLRRGVTSSIWGGPSWVGRGCRSTLPRARP
jgi:hypothetical protein